ncbi:hypothetical protein [Methylomonas sp. MgM2]
MTIIDINNIFDENRTSDLRVDYANRYHFNIEAGKIIIDSFQGNNSVFIEITKDQVLTLIFDDTYTIERAIFGGFFGKANDINKPIIWIPDLPKQRQTNEQNQIIDERPSFPIEISWQKDRGQFTFTGIPNSNLCLTIWLFDSDTLIEKLVHFNPIESQSYFLWGSHSSINKPSDLYRYLIFGSVYDARYSWPHNKRCFSENEAHSLYTIYSGLERSTGKSLYRYFQLQLVLSVIHRQSDDGGWYHGMWTDSSECHYRLHTSAVHMLLDEYARSKCPTVKIALEKAVNFLSKTTDQLDCGVWFLHDSLELSETAMNNGPFRWIPNKTLGKKASNMLVLNTHLDSTIAINRYAQLTGDRQYDELISSALNSTRAVLSLQPANWLYKPLFWAIGLTMLPTDIAKELPLLVRAIKRIASEYLVKKLPDIKAKFPRLVMPNGYIDRELSLRTWAIDYQTINLMDLARYARAFPGQLDESILQKALEFTQQSGLIKRYQELGAGKQYAPGFWLEALYYVCLSKPDMIYRKWLVEAIRQNNASGLGLSPSLLGANGEAVSFGKQISLPEMIDSYIFAINLSDDKTFEFLLINLSEQVVKISNSQPIFSHLNWKDSLGNDVYFHDLQIDGGDWIIGNHVTPL